MFKKDRQTGAFTGHIMIDFQVTRYGSPCLDLIYYFYTSVKPSVRRVRLVDLLKIYLDVFKITSNELGYHTSLSFVVAPILLCKFPNSFFAFFTKYFMQFVLFQ